MTRTQDQIDAKRQRRITRRRNARLGIPGKLRHDLAELLSDHFGWYIDPTYLKPVTGVWKRIDVYRWEYFDFNRRISLGCWETMTSFVRDAKKFGIDDDGEEIWARETKETT